FGSSLEDSDGRVEKAPADREPQDRDDPLRTDDGIRHLCRRQSVAGRRLHLHEANGRRAGRFSTDDGCRWHDPCLSRRLAYQDEAGGFVSGGLVVRFRSSGYQGSAGGEVTGAFSSKGMGLMATDLAMSILVVEDFGTMARIVQALLAKIGFK